MQKRCCTQTATARAVHMRVHILAGLDVWTFERAGCGERGVLSFSKIPARQESWQEKSVLQENALLLEQCIEPGDGETGYVACFGNVIGGE